MVFAPFHHALKGPPTDWWFGKIWFSEVGKINKKTSDSWFGMIYIFWIPPSSLKKMGGNNPHPVNPKDEGLTGFDSPRTWGISIPRAFFGSNQAKILMLTRWHLNHHLRIWLDAYRALRYFQKPKEIPPICSKKHPFCQGKVVTWGNPFSGGDSSAVQELFLTCKLMPMIRQDGSHLPSWELTNALKSPFWRWLSFSPGGIC